MQTREKNGFFIIDWFSHNTWAFEAQKKKNIYSYGTIDQYIGSLGMEGEEKKPYDGEQKCSKYPMS